MPVWAVMLMKELALGFIGKLAFKALFERLLTRWALSLLYYLASKSWNLVTVEDVDILAQNLDVKGLKAAKEFVKVKQ